MCFGCQRVRAVAGDVRRSNTASCCIDVQSRGSLRVARPLGTSMADDPTMPDPSGPETPSGPPAGDPTNAAPPGGGPMLAALSQQRNMPQVSAPGPGNQADAMMKVKSGVDLITQALP